MTYSSELTILTQNILLAKEKQEAGGILPQSERLKTIARGVLSLPYRPDIIGIQEAHITRSSHNGHKLAELCGYNDSAWLNHNQKIDPSTKRGRKNEYIGFIGVDQAVTAGIELGDQRKALVAEFGDVAFVTLHFRAGGHKSIGTRHENATRLIEGLEEYDDAVIFGDFNEPRSHLIAPGRSVLEKAGFRSVFKLLGQPSPKTFPESSYKRLEGRRLRWAIDDILVRGDRTLPLEAGVLHHDSPEFINGGVLDGTDHAGVWARISIAPKHD